MNIQSVKRVLLAITVSMIASLVLIPQVAFSQPIVVEINAEDNTCIFRALDGSENTVQVDPADKIKVAVRGGGNVVGTCKDAYLQIESGPPVVFEGALFGGGNSYCRIVSSSGTWNFLDYKQRTDKKGTTLTCSQGKPQKPPLL